VAYRGMSAQQRQICEFLMLNPGSTSADIIEGTGYPYDSVKKKLRALKESGHVKRSESNYRSSFQLTGKPFPRLADYRPNAKHLAKKARIASRESRRDVLFAAMHAMVTVGRAAA
jgi:predicted transcriptional regulator